MPPAEPARSDYAAQVRAQLRALGIPERLPAQRRLPLCVQAQRLVPVGLGTDGRDKLLTPAAARAWLAMRHHAQSGGVALLLVSAFRSIEFQAALIRAKLDRGGVLEQILQVNAPPGYSEHHTGQAVDIGTPGCAALDDAFDTTAAFRWLQRHAAGHGFRLSYPRGNPQGFCYEPWHWRYVGAGARATA